MKTWLIIFVVCCGLGCSAISANAQEPLPSVAAPMIAPELPRTILVFRKSFLGKWKVEPMTLYPAPLFVIPPPPPPKPTVIWTPQVIWR